MIKSQKRKIGAMAILVMLGASPISVTYSFADLKNNQDFKLGENGQEISKNNQKEGLGVILTEKLVDGKLKVQHYALPDDITEKDMQRALSIEEENISGWAYVNYKAYHSGIVLFDGIASKVGDDLWEISSDEMINPEGVIFYPKLGKEIDDFGIIKGKTWEKDVVYRVIFSGKTAGNDLATFFMKLGLKFPN